jgi:hypothetical protein
MAEFKLGRIRFVWKGAWADGSTYFVDDVVRYGGQTFVCVAGHTADTNFYTDLNNVPTKWNLMTDGQTWKGDWTTSTFYSVSDIVKYGGLLYIANVGHTSAATAASGLEADQDLPSETNSKWDLFAEGFDWKNNWATSTRYKKNDIVRYGGYTYVCNEGHTSAATAALGLEADSGKWDAFNQGVQYTGAWTAATRYKLNDIVKYGAGLWICTVQHTADTAFSTDIGNWAQFTEGMEFENEWSNVTVYQPGDVVRYGGNQYISKTVHSNSNPVTGTANWDLFNEGLRFQNAWSNATSYRIGSVVTQGGSVYLAAADSPSNTYTVTASNAGTLAFTTASTANMVANMSVTFTGTTFGNVFTNATYYVKQVNVGSFTISATVGGATFVPTTATGTMTATVAAAPSNTAYWSKLAGGIRWIGNWQDDYEYRTGDAVRYAANSYICVQDHRSEADDGSTVGATGGGQANSRPDQDSTGTYWNLLTAGAETSVLTTQGDLVYFGGAGPTRLPVGTKGQVLRVGEGDVPEWVLLGQVDYVYYVAPHGTDEPYPLAGGTFDRPFKTIRYACEQIDKGPINPNSVRLLELNRAFLQKEVTAWIRFQIANNIAPFTSGFDYDEYKCERDVGFIVDRLLWDISHGGNLKIRSAAFAFLGAFGEAGEFSSTVENNGYTTLAAEADEGVAAYEYLKTLVADVLSNESPAVVYQNVGQDSTAVVTQYIDTDVVAEPGIITTTDSLIDIVITALTDQDTDNLPNRIVPSSILFVKTGSYTETLPIIVPAELSLHGDETRSVTVSPNTGGIPHITDGAYSIGAIGRLGEVLGDLITGASVTPSSGNTVPQDIAFPYASSVESIAIERLTRTMQQRIDFKLNTMSLAILTDPTGYNSSYLVGYGDARKLLKENKKFLQAEIIAYITTNYPEVKYSKTICKRDVGYIVDAMIYDLTYGGYTQSLNAGTAYFDGTNSTVSVIDSSEIQATLDSYTRLKTVMQQIVANTTVTVTSGNSEAQFKDTTYATGGAAAAAFIGANIDIIYNCIAGDSTGAGVPFVTIVTVSGTNTITTSSNHNLQAGDVIVALETSNGLTAGTKYWIKSVPAGNQMTLALSYDGATITTLVNGTGLTLPATVVDNPAATNGVTSTTALITAFTTLSAATNTITSNVTAFISANYPSLVYNSAKCERDVKIIIDAVGFDFMFNSNYQTIKAAYAYLRSSASDVYDGGQKAATRAAFTYLASQMQSNVGGNATAQTRIAALMTALDDIIYSATDEGSICQTEIRAADWAVLQIERNRDFIVAEIDAWISETYSDTVTATSSTGNLLTVSDTSWLQRGTAIRFGVVSNPLSTISTVDRINTYYVANIVSATQFTVSQTRFGPEFTLTTDTGSMRVALSYNSELCLRDVGTYLDAIKFDTKYPGNYKSRLAARYYYNAVLGSLEEDMFYLRNGTGVKNMTLSGLTGDLLAPNEYGTSRVSAGAYCSLDPGWGPDDFRTWIISRSPYIQNNATFGFAAVGQKIDGSLHNGGNKSIVSNDFTQLISDGIGAWVLNNGRGELVSVFSYYSHIGYLAESGGRIRGTNGNNSYGTFGSVAEGFDITETPNTGIVDNVSQYRATVGSVLTDSADDVYLFEFDNAGQDYTEVTWTVSGSGSGALTEQLNEYRDDAVFQVHLLDNVDDSTTAPEADGNFGGIGYVTNSNTAQGGTTTQITLSATDAEISSTYIGMKVFVTGGTGAGQFGIITTYNSGTKIATVIKESTGGAGWDHVVPGTTISAPDASSTYTVEPRIQFTSPSYSSSARVLPSLQYVDSAYAETFRQYLNISGATSGSGINATFDILRKGTKYSAVIKTAGTGYARLDTITLLGTSLGGTSTNNITVTITSVNSLTGAIQAFEISGFGAGGNFVAIATGTRNVATSPDGITWTERVNALPTAAAWTALTSGRLTTVETAGSFVVGRTYEITAGGNTVFTTIGAANNNVGTIFTATGAGTGTGTATPIGTVLVAIASGGTANAYSVDGGITWTAGGALPATATWSSIASGNGRWIAVANGSADNAISINGGISWTAGGTSGALSSAAWTGIAYGQGRFVAVASGGSTTAYSTDNGLSWSAGSGLASSNWSSITYGNNRFVAVSSTSGTASAFSLNGATWGAAVLPSAAYTDVRYGQGIFLAVSQSTQAASSEDGVNWTSRTTSAAANGFSGTAFGNPNRSGIWVAVQRGTAGTVASSLLLGATAKARAFVAQEKIFAIRILEPGSGYTSAPAITITDPNNIFEAPTLVRTGKGVLATPSFINRGTGFASATADVFTGNGVADFLQSGTFIAMSRITSAPIAGSNITFGHLPDETFKVVNVVSLTGSFDGSYKAFFQISPAMKLINAPANGTSITTRIRYSQVRLTGHDFLNIGFGNFENSNYPNDPLPGFTIIQANETQEGNGGRVFFTSTDQDGNFRVGDLFTVEQSTGVATLNADAFNIAGLQELSLGDLTLGGGSASISEFSTDPFFTADSDTVVPTQRAIKAYIASQIGGGGASLNVNSVTAGFILINSDQITTTTGGAIQMKAKFDFRGGVVGLPLSWNYFLN